MQRPLQLILVILASSLPGLASGADESLAGAELAGAGVISEQANEQANEHRLQQRQQYRDALHLLQTNRITRYRQLKPELQTYPLYPYLEYNELSRGIKRRSEADILAFVDQYQDTLLAERLDQKWLAYLAQAGRWSDFIDYYEVARERMPLTRELACHLARALYMTGSKAEAMARARDLWLVAYSQPDACDAVFTFWGASLTGDLAWQRFMLSIQANQRQLASYLHRSSIHQPDKAAASNLLALRRNPARIKQIGKFRQPDPRHREVILYGVTRLARTDPEAALKALHTYRPLHDFEPKVLESAYARVGQFLVLKTDTRVIDLPVNLHTYPELAEGNIRQALRYLDWEAVLAGINLLPPTLQTTPRWQYWKARVLHRSERLAERQAARETLLALSEERTFYGFLAADLLDKPYNYQDEALAVPPEQVQTLEQSPAIQRALELFALGERGKARQEWNFTTAEFTARELGVASALASHQGWYEVAIKAMIDAGTWNHLDLRFPLAWQQSFSSHSETADISLPWSLATARQESAFMPDARSPSGALGLMQLLPTTAAEVARNLKVKYRNRASLINPELNIKLGTHYLGGLLRRFDNNRILASAAYNAGPRHVDTWLKTRAPLDVWVEVIPFTETRNYVQNVLMFASIYHRKLGASQPFIYPHERAFFNEKS